MKNNLSRILAIVAIGLIALCAAPKQAAAQDAFKGSFTLTEDVRWANAFLPAGDYTFSLRSNSVPARILLHGPNGYAMILTSARSTRDTQGVSSLTVERRAGTRFVTDLYMADLGIDLRYQAPKLPHDQIAQGPRETEKVLVAMATK
jgi:hypothetical protein